MVHWSQRRLIAVLALAALIVMEPVSWITAQAPLCLVDPFDYAVDFSGRNECPTFLEFLYRHASAAYRVVSDPHVATVLIPIFLAVTTAFLWWWSTRKIARSVTEMAAAAKTSADALLVSEQAALFTIFDTGNIPQILSELGPANPADPDVTASERLYVKFVCKNYGKSTAFLREISHDLQYWSKLPAYLRYPTTPDLPRERAVVAGASTEPIQCTLMIPVTAAIATSIRAGESFLWAVGRVLYEDSFGREREHRFLLRYRPGYGFQPHEHGDYNRNR
jgi:hypothetical protein